MAKSVGSQALDVTQPSEPMAKIRTPEQLALLEAAMMEELGICRKDTLPLEDRGYNDATLNLHSLKKTTKRLSPYDPVARWHNIQFDDVDPAMNELDSIADGQLYRLRRAAARGSTHQLPDHSGGGRGLLSNRGRYLKSGLGQGTNMSPRAGHASGVGRGLRGRTSDLASIYLGRRPPPPYSGSRRASKQSRIEKTIACLRGDAHLYPESSKADYIQPTSQESHGGQISRPARIPASPAPENFLSSPEAFLAKVGFNRNSQKFKQSSTCASDQNSSPNVAPKSSLSSVELTSAPKSISKPATSPGGAAAQGASSSVYVQKPHPFGPLGGFPAINISTSDLSIVPLSKMALAPTNPNIGLAGSRWATPGSTTSPAPTTKAAPRNLTDTPLATAVTATAPIPTIMTTPSNTVVTASATPLTTTPAAPQQAPSAKSVAPSMSWNSVIALTAVGETRFSLLAQCNTVKIVQNGGASKDGALRIIKYYGHEHSIIQIKADGVLCVDEQLVNCAISEVTGPTIIFRTAHGSSQITFPSPYEANHFEETWLNGPKTYMEKSPEKELSAQSIPDREAKTIIQIGNSDTTVHLPSENGLIVYNHDVTSDNLRQLDDDLRELPDNQNVGQLLDLNAPVQYRASDRMNNDTLHDLSTLEGGQLLISLGDDDEECVEAHENVSSALEDLLDLDNEPLLEGALNYLDHGSAGSFLQKMSRLVSTAPTSSPAITIDQILATLPAITVAESLVGEFLRRSEIFNMLTLGSAANVIKRKTKKILEIAISQRDNSQTGGSKKLRTGSDLNKVVPGVGLNQVTTLSIANQACGIVEGTPPLTTGPSMPISYFSAIPRQIYEDSNPSQSNTFVRLVLTTEGKSSRTTYTAQELLKLRAKDSTLDFEKVAKNSSAWNKYNYLVRPSRTVAVAQGATKSTNVSKPAITAQSNAAKISTAMVRSGKQLPEVSKLPAVTSSGSNPKESNLPVFQVVQQAPRPSVPGVVQHTASQLSVVQQNERLVPTTVQGKSSLPSAIQQNSGAVPAVVQDKPTVFPVIQQNDGPSVLASVQSNSSQLPVTQKIQGPVSATIHHKISVAPAVPKYDRPVPPSVFENPSTTPPAQQIELHVAATVQQNTSAAPVSQQKQLAVNAIVQPKASQLPAVQQKGSLVTEIVQERSSLAQMKLQKAVKTDLHSSSPGSSNLVGTTGVGRQGPSNSCVAPPAIAQNIRDDRAPQTGRAADNGASHQAKISRLSASAKKFNQASHKENSTHEPPSINRPRPTSSEWELITTEFGALSLRPGKQFQRVPSSAPRHGEESRTARSHLSTQPLSALPIPSNVTIQGAGLAASRWAMASHTPTLSPAFPYSTLTPNQGYAPLIQTVLIPHPLTGEMQEFTGMVKAGSIDVVAHVPIPRFIDGSQLKENIPMSDLHSTITTPRGFSTTQPPSFSRSNIIAPPRPDASFRPNAPVFQPMGQINFQQYNSHSSSPPPAPNHPASPPTGHLSVPSIEDIPATPWFRNMIQSDSESPGSFHL